MTTDELAGYLDAKRQVDRTSFHAATRFTLGEALEGRTIRVADLGAGGGAGVAHLCELRGIPPRFGLIDYLGIDRDTELLRWAGESISSAAGVMPEDRIELITGDVLAPPELPAAVDLVTAFTVADMLPTERWLATWRDRLAPDGLIWATMCFDGETALIPRLDDELALFETALIDVYHESIEQRHRVNGAGGRYSGRRLIEALPLNRLDLVSVGPSDWVIRTGDITRAGRAGVATPAVEFAVALLGFMEAEARNAGLDPASIDRWVASRREQCRDGSLIIVVHQLDVLARAA